METAQLRLLPTHEKVIWLRWTIDNNTPAVTQGTNDLVVDRDNLIADAMLKFNQMQNPRKVLKVSFVNEISQDQGGISREFFTQVTKDILSEGIGLFSKANTEEFSYVVAPLSYEIKDHQLLFKFFGRLIGKAFFDKIPVNLCLNR